MRLSGSPLGETSRLRALPDHFAVIEDPREHWRVAHPLPEVLLLVVCGTIADCNDYDHIAAWGEAHLQQGPGGAHEVGTRSQPVLLIRAGKL